MDLEQKIVLSQSIFLWHLFSCSRRLNLCIIHVYFGSQCFPFIKILGPHYHWDRRIERVIYSGKWRCKSQNIMVSLVQNALPCKLNKYCHQHPTNNALSASALTACWDVHAQCIKRVCVCVYVYVFMYVCMWGHGDGVSAHWRLLLETSLLQTTCRFCSVPHSYHISLSLSFSLYYYINIWIIYVCVLLFSKDSDFVVFNLKEGSILLLLSCSSDLCRFCIFIVCKIAVIYL